MIRGSGSGAGHFVGLAYHARLLGDIHRLDAFERAIEALVQPGDVVLDLGSGTGLLAMLCARRGAARVHAVESTPVAAVAREVVAANGFGDRVLVHRADARLLEPIEPVDLVVSDFLGRFLADDHMLEAVAAARAWLRPGGRFCPSAVNLNLAPVGNFTQDTFDIFRVPVLGLDFSPALAHALRQPQGASLPPRVILAAPQRYARFETLTSGGDVLDARLDFELATGGELKALAGWFRAELAPEVTLSTEPGIRSHWGQYLFPLPPTPVEPGDRLEVRVWLDDGDMPAWRWEGRVRRAGDLLVDFALGEVVEARRAVRRGAE